MKITIGVIISMLLVTVGIIFMSNSQDAPVDSNPNTFPGTGDRVIAPVSTTPDTGHQPSGVQIAHYQQKRIDAMLTNSLLLESGTLQKTYVIEVEKSYNVYAYTGSQGTSIEIILFEEPWYENRMEAELTVSTNLGEEIERVDLCGYPIHVYLASDINKVSDLGLEHCGSSKIPYPY